MLQRELSVHPNDGAALLLDDYYGARRSTHVLVEGKVWRQKGTSQTHILEHSDRATLEDCQLKWLKAIYILKLRDLEPESKGGST